LEGRVLIMMRKPPFTMFIIFVIVVIVGIYLIEYWAQSQITPKTSEPVKEPVVQEKIAKEISNKPATFSQIDSKISTSNEPVESKLIVENEPEKIVETVEKTSAPKPVIFEKAIKEPLLVQ